MARLYSLTMINRRRLFRALLAAFGIHLVVLFGLHFTLPANPPDTMAFSLQVALVEQEGGTPDDPGGSLPTVQPQAASRTPALDPPITSDALFTTRADTRAAPETTEPSDLPRSDFNPAADADPYNTTRPGEQNPATSRSTRLQPDERATPAGLYGERWRRLMEHLGARYFPDEARQRRLSGRLTLDVAIRADGSLHSIQLLESSGHPLLDEAARRTVLSAAPFEPFPDELRRDYDVLHILRSWEFDFGGASRPRN